MTSRAEKEMRKRLEAAPFTPIASLEEGTVAKVVGTLRARGRLLTAPLSGRPCALYEILVFGRGGGDEDDGEALIHDLAHMPFEIEDETGIVEVRTRDVEGFFTSDVRYQTGLFEEARPELHDYLKRHHVHHTTRARYREGVLEVGERVAVLGLVCFEDDPDAPQPEVSYRAAPAPHKRAYLTDPPDRFLLASDDPDLTTE